MGAQLRYLSYRVGSSFWFLPLLMLFAAGALASATLLMDSSSFVGFLGYATGLFHFEEEGARLILSTIAGSMITVTSLVYSLMLVALTLASGQLGPRLMTMFMRDRVNQLVLGTFLATFVYSLTVLMMIGSEAEEKAAFVPTFSVWCAFLLALTCFFLLVYFIHHVSEGIQADSIIVAVGAELDAEIDRVFPRSPSGETMRNAQEARPEPEEADCGEIVADKGGYIQTIDFKGLAARCEALGVHLRLGVKPGDFVIEGQKVGLVWPEDRIDDAFRQNVCVALVAGPKRTPAQDLEFRVHALVEIALRALSPGINDTRTAIACVDRLTASLARMMANPAYAPDSSRRHGNAHLSVRLLEFDDVFAIAFNEIRRNAAKHASVIFRQIDSLGNLAACAPTMHHRAVIRRQGEILQRLCDAAIREPSDREAAEKRLAHLWEMLDESTIPQAVSA